MTSQHEKPKRWRPRFSVRTLVIFVTLVCVYFGLWEATEEFGAAPLKPHVEPIEQTPDDGPHFIRLDFIHARSPAPFIVVVDESFDPLARDIEPTIGKFDTGGGVHIYRHTRTTYLWLFGPRFRLKSVVLFG